MSNKQVELDAAGLKDFMKHIISANKQLQEQGKNPVAVEIIGESGIGKTSTILQIAGEHDLNYMKLNLAQIEELGDLVGYPIRQFQMALKLEKDKEDKDSKWDMKWADEHILDAYKEKGYIPTGKSQMSYCPPEWIANKKGGGILILDDWNRADVRFIQAVMELVDRQEYISWKLPKGWNIVLTANPDNGDYLVQSIDTAQRTRFISVNLKFDHEIWAKWAEGDGIDGRCINFVLLNPECVTKETNARSITTFFNAISVFKEFEKNLGMIQQIGEGSVGPEFSSLFTSFINNKLDKLVDPKTMFTHESDEHIHKLLKSTIGVADKYRPDIAAVLCTRFTNYALVHAKDNPITKENIGRITSLINEDIFAVDLKYLIVRELLNGDKQKFSRITNDKKVVDIISKS